MKVGDLYEVRHKWMLPHSRANFWEDCGAVLYLGEDVIERARLRVRRLPHRERAGAGEETRGALRVYIGAGLESAVHPGDEGDFVLHFFQRLQRGRERERMHANGNARAIAERFAVRGKFWDRAVGFAGEKAAPHHADGDIKKRCALGGLLIGCR